MPNPGNDFLDYMTEPMDWGGPPSFWQGGAYPSSATNFAQLGGRYFGNIGSFAGSGMDMMLPQFRGMWDVRSAGGYGHMARAQQQHTMIGGMMQQMWEHQQRVADANMQVIGGQGYTNLNDQAKGMMRAMVAQAGGQRFLTPGALSYAGMQQAYGALSNYGNQWTPNQASLMGFHNAFQDYFYTGGKEQLGRTAGLAADDMMAITSEMTRRGALRPRMFSEARQAQNELFGKVALPGEFSAAGISSATVLADLESAGGDIGDLQARLAARLAARLRKSGKAGDERAISDAVVKFMAGAGSGADLESQRFGGVMSGGTQYAQIFRGFKNAGFSGDFGQLMEQLEQQFGDAALNPDRMRAMQQKMAAVVDMTGKSLGEVRRLMDVLQNGPGASLSGERAAGIAGIAASAGAGLTGLTRLQRRELESNVGNALASTEKSPRALMEDILSGSADPALQALGKQLRGATEAQGRDMVRGLMTTPGQFGLTGATAEAFKAMGVGDMRTAATMRELQDEIISRDMTTYNKGGMKDTALRERLASRGVRFNASGQAVGGFSPAERAARAGADILGGLGQGAQDALRAAGAAFGITDVDKQLQMGAALGSLSNLGSQKPAIPALREAYKKIMGQELSAEAAADMTLKGVGNLSRLGTSVNAGYYKGALDRSSAMIFYDPKKAEEAEARARRTGALNTLGEVMMSKDIFSQVFGAEKVTGATLGALGITKDATMIAGLEKLGALDDKGRQDVLMDITAVNRLTEDLNREMNPAARGKLQSDLEARQKKLAARGLDENFLAKMSGDEGAELMGRIRDASNLGGKQREIKVFVTGVLEDANGKKIGDIKDKQPNTTAPENPDRPTK